jgi:hypothetical protein
MATDVLLFCKMASLFDFSLCLSRAWLGKMIVFIYKWLKNAVFRRSWRCSGELATSWVPKKRCLLCDARHFRLKTIIYQDRLGTNIGKALKKRRGFRRPGARAAEEARRKGFRAAGRNGPLGIRSIRAGRFNPVGDLASGDATDSRGACC